MADSDQAKAALAALADGESGHGEGAGTGEPHRHDRGESRDGHAGALASTAPERGEAGASYRAVIERAVAATEDLDAAAEFVDTVGMDRLEAAVKTAEHEVSGLAGDGREALATFERFRAAAEG